MNFNFCMCVCLFVSGNLFTKTFIKIEIYTILFRLELNYVEN